MTKRIVLEAAWMVPLLRLSRPAKRPRVSIASPVTRVEGDKTGHL
jgi:hypothetical protein